MSHSPRTTPRSIARSMYPLCTDPELVAGVRRGDQEAFEEIVRRYRQPLVRYCTRLLRGAPAGEDAAQTCLANAWTAIASDNRQIDLKPWLYRIAHNHCISALRARTEDISLEEMGLEVGRYGSSVTAAVERRERIRELVADIKQLPCDQRRALILGQLEGLSGLDISRSLGCTPARTRALTYQARQRLIAMREARNTAHV